MTSTMPSLPAEGPSQSAILIIADAFRQDSLGGFGPTSRFTPRLSARFESWVRFRRCQSAAPWTLPACTSLLTGVNATRHGRFTHRVRLAHRTIAEHLGPEFVRAAFVNNTNLKTSSGLQCGFDHYQYLAGHDEPFERAARFIEERRKDGKRFFLVVHTNIPHDYYLEMARPYHDACFPESEWYEVGRNVVSWTDMPEDARARGREAYDASVFRMDRVIDEFLDCVDMTTASVAFVSDHGEGFDFARGRVHHGGRVHDDLVNVPLAIHVPPAQEKQRAALGLASEEAVCSVDVVPTLLGILGVPLTASVDGVDLSQRGVPAARVLPVEDRRYLYLSSGARLNSNFRGKNTTWAIRARNLSLRMSVARRFAVRGYLSYPKKLVATTLVPAAWVPEGLALAAARYLCGGSPVFVYKGGAAVGLELFDVEADPDETRNLLWSGNGQAVGIDDGVARFRSVDIPTAGRDHSLGEILGA